MTKNTITTTTNPTLTFTGDADTGIWSSGDFIKITTDGTTKKQINNYKKVHVARRRHAKQNRPGIWRITDVSATTLTV